MKMLRIDVVMKVLRIGVVLLVGLFGVGPLVATWLAGIIAAAAGCRLHEGFVNECLVGGHDLGEPLYHAGMAFWITVVSWSMLIPVVLLWMICEIVAFVARRWRE